jgi:hypothetical protein
VHDALRQAGLLWTAHSAIQCKEGRCTHNTVCMKFPYDSMLVCSQVQHCCTHIIHMCEMAGGCCL